jgi:hypothetical protein
MGGTIEQKTVSFCLFVLMAINPDISPDGRALACPLFPQEIFLSRKYTLVFRFFGKFLVKTNYCAIISSPGEISGLTM